jgi:heme exporter protein C
VNQRPAVVRALPHAAAVSIVIAMAMAFFYAPTEAVQGHVQRVFYVHVPTAWVSYLAFIVVAAASVLVLRARDSETSAMSATSAMWDRIAGASAEVGMVFTTVFLVTGMIWAKRAWGTAWAWDARLTSTLVLWLIYGGYVLFRTLTPPGERRARTSAVVGIIGAIDIPLIHFAVMWWNSAHPAPTVLRPGGPDLPGEMLATLLVSLVAFTMLYAALLVARIELEDARTRTTEAREVARATAESIGGTGI